MRVHLDSRGGAGHGRLSAILTVWSEAITQVSVEPGEAGQKRPPAAKLSSPPPPHAVVQVPATIWESHRFSILNRDGIASTSQGSRRFRDFVGKVLV